jgi:16S rRNA (guanine966-N2)-methyltransferase
MRIIAGSHRGRPLVPLGAGDAAAQLRPTSDRVRESLFNLLAHGPHGTPPPPQGRRVLDLFAGTGALGLEALSRGAEHATFVENGAVGLGLLRANVAGLGVGDAVQILAADAARLGANSAAPFDLVFLDPPYRRGLGERALAAAGSGGWLAPGALVVWEEAAAPAPPPGLTLLDARRYGDTMISLLRAPE